MVKSISFLENGPFTNMGITGQFYMPNYFNPTIDFNMVQYTQRNGKYNTSAQNPANFPVVVNIQSTYV